MFELAWAAGQSGLEDVSSLSSGSARALRKRSPSSTKPALISTSSSFFLLGLGLDSNASNSWPARSCRIL